jgi:HlyD family secretion protein
MPRQTNPPDLPISSDNGRSPDYLIPAPLDVITNQPSPPIRSPASNSQDGSWSYVTQELLDSLPRIWTRGLLYFLVIVATIVLPWASLSKVDETGTARGRLEPQGKTVRLDAPVSGTVTDIQVKEGQSVRAGQTILELNSEEIRNDLQQGQAKLEGQSNRLSQLQLIRTQLEITSRTQVLQNQAQATAQLAEINQTERQQQFNQDAYELAQALLAKDDDTVQRFRGLREEGIISGIQLDESERRMIENTERLKKTQSDIKQAQEELTKQQSTYESTIRAGELAVIEGKRQLEEIQAQITDLKSEIAQTKNQIKSLQYQLEQHILRTPVAGKIFQLPIQQAGAVLQPGTMVAQIAPQGSSLILRAQMASQESGFLHPGMPVKIKFDAYPFQDYGVIEGQLSWISPDSKIQDTERGQIEMFELEIALNQFYIQTPTRQITLTPGQTATAEVIIRQRRIIDFILDPFKKLQKDGLNL